MKEALLYNRLEGERVRCALCAHRCLIAEGARGICQVRENRAGALYTRVYGLLATQAVDPIEKKPLFHFLPGSRSYSIATVGCNFHCTFCQNADISQMPRETGAVAGRYTPPEAVVEAARRSGCRSIAYTYTEPTVFFEYTLDVAHLARYSPRPGTVSERRMLDDVPEREKWRRFRMLEDLQEKIATDIHSRYMNRTVDVLFEVKNKRRWQGRTPTNKLVFVESEGDLLGQVRPVKIQWTGPWSMLGVLATEPPGK